MEAVNGLMHSSDPEYSAPEAVPPRGMTPLDAESRMAMVISPTSLLLSNTNLQSTRPAHNHVWSPQTFTDQHSFGSTPTLPEGLDDHPNTPVRNFVSIAPRDSFKPIPQDMTEKAYPMTKVTVTKVTPSRPIPSPLPAPMYK
jgi:hypothetical protein